MKHTIIDKLPCLDRCQLCLRTCHLTECTSAVRCRCHNSFNSNAVPYYMTLPFAMCCHRPENANTPVGVAAEDVLDDDDSFLDDVVDLLLDELQQNIDAPLCSSLQRHSTPPYRSYRLPHKFEFEFEFKFESETRQLPSVDCVHRPRNSPRPSDHKQTGPLLFEAAKRVRMLDSAWQKVVQILLSSKTNTSS